MDVKHLEAFVATLELGSISATARQLKKGQPLISQWLQELEVDLRVELFSRTGNKVTANQNAFDLLPFALKVLNAQNAFNLAAHNIERGELQHIVIALDQWVPAQPLHNALAKFMAQFPTLNIEVQTLCRDDIIDAVKAQEIHVGIISEFDEVHHQVSFKRIGFYEDVYVASQKWLAQQRKGILSLTEIESQRELILSVADDEDDHYSQQTYLQLSNFELLLSLLKEGAGFAILPKQTVLKELETGQLKVFSVAHETVALERRVEIIWPHASEKIIEVCALLNSIEKNHAFHR